MAINKKIIVFLIGLAVFGFTAAPQPAQAFNWGEFGGAVYSLPQTIASWFGGLFSNLFGAKKTELISDPAIQPPVESSVATVGINPEIDEKSCQQDSDCVIVSVRDEKDKCCDECGEEAINRSADRNRQVWRETNCLDKENHECPIWDCVAQKGKAVCENNQCVLKLIERIAVCGDGKCEDRETTENCQQDCPCAGLGETLSPKNNCCAGLVAVSNYYQIDSQDNCFRKTDTNVKSVCVNCGNGKCETNEDKCNCPKDCGNAAAGCGNGKCEPGENAANCGPDCPADSCVEEGNEKLVVPEEAPDCCAGLTEIFDFATIYTDCSSPSNGTMICAKCGDGICGLGENKCNCSKDCDIAADCASEGEWIDVNWKQTTGVAPAGWKSCCAGLETYTESANESVKNGICVGKKYGVMSSFYLCVKCGDGICNAVAGENICNCPGDCK